MNVESQTVTGIKYSTTRLFGLPWSPSPRTLNHTVNHHPGVVLASDTYSAEWVILGNGGYSDPLHPTTPISETDKPVTFVGVRDPNAGSLYNMIPLIARTAANDLTPAERSLYGLRKEVSKGGTTHYFYFAKKAIAPSVIGSPTVIDTMTGETNGYTGDIPDFNPARVTDTSANDVSTTAISVSTGLGFRLSIVERQEVKEACDLYYGSEGHDLISEIGVCVAGWDGTRNTIVGAELLNSATLQSPHLPGVINEVTFTVHYGGEILLPQG